MSDDREDFLRRAENTLAECADTMERVAQGYECFDEEDGAYRKCPACGGWITHYGHSPTCELPVMQKRALRDAALLKALIAKDAQAA